jgi:hypothetical protein
MPRDTFTYAGTVPLDPRTDLWNHSPSGVEWGYGGSGPAQLALAILAHEFDDRTAVRYHQEFKWAVVVGLGDKWQLSSEQVRSRIESAQASDQGEELPF